MKKSHGLFLLALAALLSTGCGRTADTAHTSPASVAEVATLATLDRCEVENGPVRLLAVVDPPALSLCDEARLTLTIDYADGVDVEFPPFGKKVGGFLIRDVRQPLPKTADRRHIIQKTFRLEPLETGRATIYPINVTYTDNRDGTGDGKKHSLRTDELSVNVTSVVEPGDASLENLRPVAEPVALPLPPRYVLWSSVLAVVLIAAGAGFVWWRRKSIASAKERILTPGELACRALERLRRSQLAQRDAKLYYVELTGIVRLYIERTTGIRAPEQTTEEFLREIARRDSFPREESVRFRNFLEAADLVKFAAFQPRSADIEESFARAGKFVSGGQAFLPVTRIDG